MEEKPILLDLFCGAGGCARGYMDAGFYVVGVDIERQPHYCGDEFYQADALHFLDTADLVRYACIHASPVCKAYTVCNRPNRRSLLAKDDYPRLIADVRNRLVEIGKPYVIENVVGAKQELQATLLLCASMFGLPMQRHRLFEIGNTSLFIPSPGACDHTHATISVVGGSVWDASKIGTVRKDGRIRPASVPAEIGREAMGIDWMTKREMAQAIPPAYTRYIGSYLINMSLSTKEENNE